METRLRPRQDAGSASARSPSLSERAQELGPWFHNLHLPDGSETAPGHFLGDFPARKWAQIEGAIPESLEGWTALDVGCNAGFYSFELARRGAQVTAIDYDQKYLAQARWAAEVFGLSDRVLFEHKQVYDLAHAADSYDIVWFMGVLYHLRYPLLGLDIVSRKTRRLLVLQTMTSPGQEVYTPAVTLNLKQRVQMNRRGWPKMSFIEHRLEGDPTNWWAPNHACVEAMLRSSGMEVISRPAHEMYICRPSVTQGTGLDELRECEFLAATGQLWRKAADER